MEVKWEQSIETKTCFFLSIIFRFFSFSIVYRIVGALLLERVRLSLFSIDFCALIFSLFISLFRSSHNFIPILIQHLLVFPVWCFPFINPFQYISLHFCRVYKPIQLLNKSLLIIIYSNQICLFAQCALAIWYKMNKRRK